MVIWRATAWAISWSLGWVLVSMLGVGGVMGFVVVVAVEGEEEAKRARHWDRVASLRPVGG